MDMRAQYRNNRVNTVGEGNPVIVDGDTGQNKEWIGLRLKKERERENSVFTTQFMVQLRFVSVGFVSCPLPAVDRLVCTGGLNPVSRPESKRFHPLESPLQSKHVQGDSGGRMEMRRASWHPLAPSPRSAPRCFVLSPSIPERFFVPPVTRLQNT